MHPIHTSVVRPIFLASAVLVTATALVLSGGTRADAVAIDVGLGAAESFAVLAYSTVTNTGPSIISGDIGLHPGSAVTGFPPGNQAAGATYVASTPALQARLAATAAYTAARLQSGAVLLSGTDLGGQIFLPDLYDSPDVLSITGTLTLDADNDPDAVFIFRSKSAFDTASSSNVLLINQADLCNVFWIVPSSATLGTNSSLVGTVIASTSITATTGTSVHGRLLALNGAVTLDSTTVDSTGCAAPVANDGSGTTAATASTATATAAAAAAAAASAAARAAALSGSGLADSGVEGEALLVVGGAALAFGGILMYATRRRGLHI